jgi:hypothetical protein
MEAFNLLDRRIDLGIIVIVGEGDAGAMLACPVSGLSRRENGLEP